MFYYTTVCFGNVHAVVLFHEDTLFSDMVKMFGKQLVVYLLDNEKQAANAGGEG